MAPTVYLVTGATRGIGYQLVKTLSTRPDTIIYAGTRSFPLQPDHQLAQLAKEYPDNVIPIKITSADEGDNGAAAKKIKETAGKLDVIIANAGAGSGLNNIITTPLSNFQSDLTTNTLGPIVLFQAFHSLLLESAKSGSPKFVVISSKGGQITEMLPYRVAAYGMSKAAANYIAKKIDMEVPEIIAFPMHPGMVDTDMSRRFAEHSGVSLDQLGAISTAESVEGILAVVDKATKDTHGGRFWEYNGTELTY